MTSVYHPASIRNSASGGTVSSKSKGQHTAGAASGGASGQGMMTSSSAGGVTSLMRQSAGHLLRPHVENCGYLLKQGSSTYSTFRKRWFVLTDGKLFYYETRQATFELGLVDLVNVTNVDAGMDASSPPGSSPSAGNSSVNSSLAIAVSSTGATGSALSASASAPSLLGEYLSSTSHETGNSTSSNSASNNSSDSFRFRVETPKRIYQLVAASEPEMWQWISSLRLARLVLHEREMMRDSLRQQIEFGRRMRDEQAAAVSLLEAEHAAHTDARHRLVELTERNDQLRDWNDRVTTQLEHTELELARTRQKLRDALVYVRAYEIAQVAGADLVRRLDLREQQVDALRAQLEALASSSSASGAVVAALPEAAVEAAARVNALTSEIEAENDELAASQTMILSTSDVGLSEASIRDLRDELKRRDELPIPPSSLAAAEAASARDAELAASAAALAADSARRPAEQKRPVWVPTEAVDDCSGCHAQFSLLRWKKRCSGCGGVFCSDCVPNQVTMRFQNDFKSVRVCNDCYKRAMQAHETKRKERAAAAAAATAAAQAAHAAARASD